METEAPKPKRDKFNRLKRTGSTQAERDLVALGLLESYMDGIVSHVVKCPTCGKSRKFKEPTPAQAALIRARYDKLRPSLQSIEQTVHDPRDKVSEADIVSALESMLNASPGVAETLAQLCVKADPSILARLSAPTEQTH